jgi:hypothetical protein
MHYNENSQRPQARNKQGELVYAVRFLKYKKGGYTVQPVRERQTFKYVARLMTELTEQTIINSAGAWELWKEFTEPPTLSSACQRPELLDAVEQHMTRFSKK